MAKPEPSATALVLTHVRPRHATEVVRGLVENEELKPSQVVLVVNGEGGLDDPGLEAAVRVLRLSENVGPAGGFASGLRYVRDSFTEPWVYVCEDDMERHNLPSPRLGGLIERVQSFEREVPGLPVGAVLAEGWDVDRRTGLTSRHRFRGSGRTLEEVDFGAWQATLVSRRVLEAGVFPDEALFWWAEDMDFFLAVRDAGFRVLVDVTAAHDPNGDVRAVRDTRRPDRKDEPWSSYYIARNHFRLRRRHGNATWTAYHLMKTARRLQLAPSGAHRAAIIHGLIDGFRGRTGKNREYVRAVGEW
jgi:hypothetical protein